MKQKQPQPYSKYDQMRKNLSFGIEQQLMFMLYKIIQKKNSQIFRQPVDPIQFPDYYQQISHPTDLSTILNKLKQGKYGTAAEVRNQLQLMIQNCKQYNSDPGILTLADRLHKSIQTQWTNFQKQLKKANITIDKSLVITDKVAHNFMALEQREKNKKNKRFIYSQLGLTLEEAANILERTAEKQNLQNKNQGGKQKQIKFCQYQPEQYENVSVEQIQQKLNFQISLASIRQQHEKHRLKKVQKYKKLLSKKILWIHQKIIQKCLNNQNYLQFQSLKYLSRFIQDGQIAARLQIKKIQQYVKMAAYWLKDYQQVLSTYMKDKFITICQEITQCIFRAIKFININNIQFLQKSHSSQQNQPPPLNPNPSIIKQVSIIQQTKSQFIKKQHSRLHENEIKQFKKMMQRDLNLTNKKYLTIIIRYQDGVYSVANQWAIKDHLLLARQARKRAHVSKYQKELQDERERERMRKVEFEEDLKFVEKYSQKKHLDIIQKYGEILAFDYQTVKLKEYPVLEFRFQNFNLL